ncbi:hypothetical protein E4631_24460 [Hymenobacter sp. UV11]|nr:hypothetical protein [Hymenobacter sp. UV11]TFZ62788.1 hypothetical protein E4631_24460 [Hymenobacter sp. UV11]
MLPTLVACEQQLPLPDRSPSVLVTTTTLKQPNGAPVNVHVVNMANLAIDRANRYQRLLNTLSKEQQKAHRLAFQLLCQTATPTQRDQERLAQMLGFRNRAESEELLTQTRWEYTLLQQEDPAYFALSKAEQLAIYQAINTSNRLNGGPTFVRPTGSPAEAR